MGRTSAVRRRVGALDVRLVDRSARLEPSGIDPSLRRLSGFANHSKLWMVIAALLALTGKQGRRAAVRGLLSIAGASALANAVSKPLSRRARPIAGSVPVVRALVHPPDSSSFPSGHSASAAAFTTGVALEYPAAGAAIAPLAAAVGYSRVHVGVHWPSDVVAGFALGTAVAVSTRRWWAVRDAEPATMHPGGTAPAIPAGAGLIVLVNPGAGSSDGAIGRIRKELPQAQIMEPDPDRDFGDQFAEQIRDDTVALGVCGGDGTVATAVAVAIDKGLPLAVFPGGTLNHFARDAGVDELDDTIGAVRRGESGRVDVAALAVDGVDDRYFVNTASIGGYPDTVRIRDRLEPRIGKWPAAAVAMARVLARAEPLEVEIDDRRESVWLLFIGNGSYAPTDKVPMSRPSMSDGTLDVRWLRADLRMSRSRLLFAALTGTLGSSPTYTQRRVASVRIDNLGAPISIATDGEVEAKGREFAIDCRPGLLTVYRPD